MAKRYGKWLVVESIGEGAQAHLFKVRRHDDPDEEIFALKRLRKNARLDRFETEIRAVQTIDHPAIIKVVDFDIKGDKPYFVMPYYPRGNVRDAQVPTWDLEKRLELFCTVIEGLSAAHGKEIVHRDLYPDNILVDENDSPVLADFGICFVEAGKRITMTEERLGARDYVAPEVEHGREKEVSSSSDVYSLGKILYWLLAGRVLPREYHRRPEYELHRLDSRYEVFSLLLDKMVVENTSNRFKSAADLEPHFAQAVEHFRRVINYPSRTVPQRCRYCGLGDYKLVAPQKNDGSVDSHALQTVLGIRAYQEVKLRVLACPVCGNIQQFDIDSLDPTHKRTWFGE